MTILGWVLLWGTMTPGPVVLHPTEAACVAEMATQAQHVGRELDDIRRSVPGIQVDIRMWCEQVVAEKKP